MSSGLIDRVVAKLGRRLCEVPVGFKWFVPGLFDGSLLLRRRGERRGELPAAGRHRVDDRQGRPDPGAPGRRDHRAHGQGPGRALPELTAELGTPYYTRIDAPATPEQKARLRKLSPEAVTESKLAGEPITAKLTRAPGNDAPIGGLKVIAAGGWFAARPSGTENIYKIYAESFKSPAHLDAIVREAQAMVDGALR